MAHFEDREVRCWASVWLVMVLSVTVEEADIPTARVGGGIRRTMEYLDTKTWDSCILHTASPNAHAVSCPVEGNQRTGVPVPFLNNGPTRAL